MAQSSKSRIVIWTIVGILVVIAAVMLIKKPKNVERPPVNVEQFTRAMESRFQKFERKMDQAKADFPGTPAEQWQKMSDDIARGRQLLGEMAGLTEQKDVHAKVLEVQKAFAEARKTLKAITGKEDSGDSSGGQ
ncbi:MAG: hypothetical protein NTX53_02545 [candidate division WOR-3 bacterium]|nr:hypothetical protein [candidate division WOR-3 bacterium]